MRLKKTLQSLFVFFILFISADIFAFPNEQKQLLDFTTITSQAVQMFLTSDNSRLYLGFNDQVVIIDLARFELAATQPFDFGSDPDLEGLVGGITLSNTKLYVTKEDGDMLIFDLDDITAEPESITIQTAATGDTVLKLGKVVINAAKTRLYILDHTNNNIIVHTIGSAASETIDLPDDNVNPTNFSVTNVLLVESLANGSDYIYVTTDKGYMFIVVDGDNFSNRFLVGEDTTKSLVDVAVRPGKDSLYVINTTDDSLIEVDPTTLAKIETIVIAIDNIGDPLDEVHNTSLTGVVSSNNNIEASIYTYVSGLKGISVLDANNALEDIPGGSFEKSPIDTGSRFGPMVASTDNYIYMSNEGGTISVITDVPLVTIESITYSSGGTSLSNGETATIKFKSDVTGTYSVKVGGDVSGSGAALVDTSGSSTGTVATADTDIDFTFAYDDNSGNLEEGDNTAYIFVTDSSGRIGRDAITVSVDTPPPAITVNSTGFGNTRVYLNFVRLTVSDMSHYNIYASTDPDAVTSPPTVSAVQFNQPSSGTNASAEIDGLTNGSLYYLSIEGVDEGGNIGPLTTTFADGTRISETPEPTVGPLELLGEKGCSLIDRDDINCSPYLTLFLLLIVLYLIRFKLSNRLRVKILLALPLLIILLIPADLSAQDKIVEKEHTPQWWTTELKGGFWMPLNSTMKDFFKPCCNLMGMVEQGFLYDSKYGAEVGVGFLSLNGDAVGSISGDKSQDRFNLFLLPMLTQFAFRADFKTNQIIVPYAKVGVDYVYFRQSLKGKTINGVKFGLHTTGGIQILLDGIDSGAQARMERDWGINDIYFTLEGRYSWINNFGGGGLDLSSLLFSFGLLLQY